MALVHLAPRQPSIVLLSAWLLLLSALVHGLLFFWSPIPWDSPVSLRKPILFGISGGATLWSIDWVWSRLRPWSSDRWLSIVLSLALVGEVVLITAQIWRGQPSHFNRQGWLNSRLDEASLLLITIVVLILFLLTVRSLRGLKASPPLQLAMQAGMLFLMLSSGLGYASSFLGYGQIDRGLPPETLGPAGVIKFPHGACLHALQTLPLLTWILAGLHLPLTLTRMRWWTAAHGGFLAYALWQTATGRARWEWNPIGMVLLALVVLTGLLALRPDRNPSSATRIFIKT